VVFLGALLTKVSPLPEAAGPTCLLEIAHCGMGIKKDLAKDVGFPLGLMDVGRRFTLEI
jgi:hypothetical protein